MKKKLIHIKQKRNELICKKIFVKNYFVILFLSSEMLFWAKKMIFLSNKTHFSEWSWLLNNFNKISMKKFLSGNILSHCVLSEMFSLAPEWKFLAMKSIYWLVTIVENLYWNCNFTETSSILVPLRTHKKSVYLLFTSITLYYAKFLYCSSTKMWKNVLMSKVVLTGPS